MNSKVLIVGAGNMGAAYDNPSSKEILTHAHAYTSHPHFELGGFVDSNEVNLKKAQETWGGKAYQSIQEAFAHQSYDVVSVTVPDQAHLEILKQLTAYKTKLIFAEKPFVRNGEEYKELKAMPGFDQSKYCLNYRRRFVPEIRSLQEKIKAGHFGALVTGTGIYGKGFRHNGTHLLDLINFLVGDFKSASIVDSLNDYGVDDPSYSVHLKYTDGATLNINAVDSRCCTVFELDLVFDKGRVRLTEIGHVIEEYSLQQSQSYPDHRFFKLAQTINTSLSRAMFFAVDNIYRHLTQQEELHCSVQDAVVLFNQLDRIKT